MLGLGLEHVVVGHLAQQVLERDRLPLQCCCRVQRALVVEQILDHALQLHAVFAHDPDDFPLLGRERAAHFVMQQFRALPERGERRLEFVRNVPQKPVLLRLELGEAAPEPVEPVAQVLQVVRPGHPDRPGKIRAAQLPDRGVQFADRTRDDAGKDQRDRHCEGDSDHQEQGHSLAHPLRRRLQPLDLTVGDHVTDREHFVSALGQVAGVPGHQPRIELPGRGGHQHIVKRLLLLDRTVERPQLLLVQGQHGQLVRNHLETLPHARVVGDKLGVGKDDVLLGDALDRADPVYQRSARARSLRRIENRVLGLPGEALGVPPRIHERNRKRQGDQQETGDQQLEERARKTLPGKGGRHLPIIA